MQVIRLCDWVSDNCSKRNAWLRALTTNTLGLFQNINRLCFKARGTITNYCFSFFVELASLWLIISSSFTCFDIESLGADIPLVKSVK